MFKIKAKKLNKNEFIIEVIDDGEVIQTKLANNILERDKIIYDLCDMHDIVDVEYINMEKLQSVTPSDIDVPIIPYTDMFQLEDYFDSNNKYIFDRILDAIEDGIATKKKKIKLFQINASGIFVDSLKRDWPAGLRLAHEFFIEEEDYAKVQKCLDLLSKLKATL